MKKKIVSEFLDCLLTSIAYNYLRYMYSVCNKYYADIESLYLTWPWER